MMIYKHKSQELSSKDFGLLILCQYTTTIQKPLWEDVPLSYWELHDGMGLLYRLPLFFPESG